ncbi:MAG: cytochrome c3 family protein [Desulfovibrio sp.]|nr:cytochrome c3 family protein [Desulfovibrio sp.]
MPAVTLRSTCAFLCSSLVCITCTVINPHHACGEEVLTLKNPTIAVPTMPRVLFNHDKHMAYVEQHESDCSRCHRVTSKGLSIAVLDVLLQKTDRQVPYLHAACTECHTASGRGPSLAECRACHAGSNTLRAMQK